MTENEITTDTSKNMAVIPMELYEKLTQDSKTLEEMMTKWKESKEKGVPHTFVIKRWCERFPQVAYVSTSEELEQCTVLLGKANKAVASLTEINDSLQSDKAFYYSEYKRMKDDYYLYLGLYNSLKEVVVAFNGLPFWKRFLKKCEVKNK